MIKDFLLALPKDTVIIEGEAPGADTIAREEADKIGLVVEKYRAKWNLYGRGAGIIRNTEMRKVGKPDKVVAFHNDIGSSKGTKNMIKQSKAAGITCNINK